MKKILVAMIFCVLISSTAFGWDDTGHKLTTYIAWKNMTRAAREKAFNILMAAPEDSDLSVFYLQGSRSEEAKRLELFMIASTWSDIVRDKNFKVRFEKYHKGTWHYLDTSWMEENGKIKVLENLSEAKENAVERLFAFDALLKDTTKTDADKSIALAWILHLAGDIHQPLHCSGRVTNEEQKGDQGGNLFKLTPKKTPRDQQENLHWFWDSIIMRNIARMNDACDSDYLPPIGDGIMKKFPVSKMQDRFKLGKFDEWQQEGFRIASTEVYANGLKRWETPSDTYKKKAFEISEEQIALAGYRMAAMFNQIFDGKPVMADVKPAK